MYCRYCGEQIEEGKNYCKACGRPIEDNSSVAEKVEKIEDMIGLLVICIGVISPILGIIIWALNHKKYPTIGYKAKIGIALGIVIGLLNILPLAAFPISFIMLVSGIMG